MRGLSILLYIIRIQDIKENLPFFSLIFTSFYFLSFILFYHDKSCLWKKINETKGEGGTVRENGDWMRKKSKTDGDESKVVFFL